ncbi:hypothetical protein ACHWQZ_G010310 [Mnemiopsis leidyi]
MSLAAKTVAFTLVFLTVNLEERNLALDGTASQVDTLSSYEASLAIDDAYGRFSHTRSKGLSAWWLLTLKNRALIREIKIYNRMECCQHRIDGATVWIGDNLIGGNYEGAVAVGTVQYEKGKTTYIFSEIDKAGSSVEIQGGPITETVPDKNLHMLEVQVYGCLNTASQGQKGWK